MLGLYLKFLAIIHLPMVRYKENHMAVHSRGCCACCVREEAAEEERLEKLSHIPHVSLMPDLMVSTQVLIQVVEGFVFLLRAKHTKQMIITLFRHLYICEYLKAKYMAVSL